MHEGAGIDSMLHTRNLCETTFMGGNGLSFVADSGEGVCVDPGERGAILETGGTGPLERGKGRQLAPDSRGEGM